MVLVEVNKCRTTTPKAMSCMLPIQVTWGAQEQAFEASIGPRLWLLC